MCGFAGVISLNNSLDNSVGETLNLMNSVLKHRGPDDGDTKLVGPCGLTHTRLNVIDLTEAGKQPMSNEDGSIWITYNGEVYNFQELRRDYALDLKGHSFRSRTDTEVIIHLYEEKGIDYPYAYVRWTENRNMTEYLRLVDRGEIKLEPIISATYSIEKVTDAFESLNQNPKPLMVLLDYGMPSIEKLNSYLMHNRKIIVNNTPIIKDIINVALVGAGGFATGMH